MFSTQGYAWPSNKITENGDVRGAGGVGAAKGTHQGPGANSGGDPGGGAPGISEILLMFGWLSNLKGVGMAVYDFLIRFALISRMVQMSSKIFRPLLVYFRTTRHKWVK